MGFAIAILLTLAMAGSVLWVMPTPREKRISAMRKRAMEMQVRVRLIDHSMASQLIDWVPNYRGYVSYELTSQPGKETGVKGFKSIRLSFDEGLHELDKLDPLRQVLEKEQLLAGWPKSSEALVFNPLGVMLVWREDGDEKDVQELIGRLRLCLEADRSGVKAEP
jgi:hypothetical protein